jgi:sulfoxide reductase heme-binding subunit YedZ
MSLKKRPWRDNAGRFAPLKAAVFAALFLPACWVAVAYATDQLGARPLNEAIHEIGRWTIRLLFVALAVTPFRQALRWPRLVLVRRMIGVAASAYALLHLGLYTVDQAFDLGKIATEIVLRVYLLIGFSALLGLAALAATSTDAMIRRLGGRRWRRLHRLVYPIAVLAVVHQFMQSKADVVEPTVMAGMLLWLMAWRAVAWTRADGRVPLPAVALLGLGAAAMTALGEAIYFTLKVGAPIGLVLEANLNAATGIRPAWLVGGAALAVLVGAAVREVLARAPKRRLRYS